MLAVIAALFLSAAAEPAAQSVGEVDCSQAGQCRTVGKVVVRPKGAQPMTFNINRTLPWIAQDNLMIFAGEAAIIRLETREGRLVPVLVEGGAGARREPAEGEIRVVFTETDGQAYMEVKSRHPRPVHYSAVMVTPDGKPSRTSVCTLTNGRFVMEHWPHPIVQLALSNFVEQAEDAVVCR